MQIPPKKKAKAYAREVQAEAQEATESPPTESSSSERDFPYTNEFERSFSRGSLREAERAGRPEAWANEAEDSGSNKTQHDKSRVPPTSSKKQQEEEVPSLILSEEDAFWEWRDEAQEISWSSETQEAFTGAVSADAMTDGETSEESWPILHDLLFGGRGVSEMMLSHIGPRPILI